MKKIMIVEDEKTIREELRDLLENAGYHAQIIEDFQNSLEEIKESKADLILLDINIPNLNGELLLKEIRKESNVPVIMDTSRVGELDEVLSMSYGADDYITKPFNILEVKARIKAILRRNSKQSKNPRELEKRMITAGSLRLDRDGRRVFVGSKEINLTAKEFDLLELLACNPNKVYSREALLGYVWGNKADSGDVRTVDVHVRRLREKIEPSPSAPQFVHTKWGVGYYFRAQS